MLWPAALRLQLRQLAVLTELQLPLPPRQHQPLPRLVPTTSLLLLLALLLPTPSQQAGLLKQQLQLALPQPKLACVPIKLVAAAGCWLE